MDGFEGLMMGAPAAIGHNRAPSDLDVLCESLEERLAPLAERLVVLREGANRLPARIATRDAAENAADLLRMLAALRQSVEEQRKEEKAPRLAAAKAVDVLCAPLADDAKAIEAALSPRLIAWLDVQPRRDNGKIRVRTQLGAVASLSESERVVVESREAVDLEALRPFLDFEILEKAARAYHAQHKSVPAGVRVERAQRLIIR